MFRVIPGDPVEFAQLPLGAIHDLPESEGPYSKLLWVKISAKKSAALIPEKVATIKELTVNPPKNLLVKRYWIGGESDG